MIVSDANELELIMQRMATDMQTLLDERRIDQPRMIGIHTGGVWIAKRLHALLNLALPLGTLDISFYRDDFTRIGMHPQVKPSQLPFDVENQAVILVDDVLQTGRTIRAALNEIFDYGRPSCVLLTALAERSGRELPIQADVVGKHFPLQENEYIKLAQDPEHGLVLQLSSQ